MNGTNEVEVAFKVSQLVTRYNFAWDEQRFADVAKCFTPSGVFVDGLGRQHAGREAIIRFGEKSVELFGSMRHLTTNHSVDLVNGIWRHRCYLVFASNLGTPESSTTTGHYLDEFAMVEEHPLFTIRRVSLDSM